MDIELTFTYIMSQIMVIIYYLLYSYTFHLYDKKKILFWNIIGVLASSFSYIFLRAYIGMAMCIVAIIRNILFYKNDSKWSLILIYFLIIVGSILTYTSIFGLFNTISTSIITYSLWQKSSKRYKLLGIFANIFILIYDIYLKSIMGVIFILIALGNSIWGYIKEYKKVFVNK